MFFELLKVAGTSVASLAVLYILTKLMGKKQISELSLFDYIIGISIGSIAAEMATEIEKFEKPLLAMVIYALFAVLISLLESHSYGAMKLFSGLPLILYEDGKIYEKALHKCKFSVNDLLSQARQQGYFSLSEIKIALMEPDGKISFLPFAANRPLCPADMNITPQQEEIPVTVIVDGKIIYNNLEDTPLDEKMLRDALSAQGITELENIVLATVDSSKNVSVYSKTD